MAKTSEAQLRASKKWNQENKDYKRVRDYRSKGLKFIRDYSNLEDIEEFRKVLKDREDELKGELQT